MASQRNRISVGISSGLCITTAVLFLTVPFQWTIAWILATLFHELCHYLMLCALGIRVFSMQARMQGFTMETEPMSRKSECISALAGPLGALILVAASRWFPELAVCAYVQSAYNLLPIFPLDGGRALRCIASYLLPDVWGMRLCVTIEGVAIFIITAGGILAVWMLHLGPIPLVVSAIILFRYLRIKSPCKDRKLRVQ